MKNTVFCCYCSLLIGISLSACHPAGKAAISYAHSAGFITVADSKLYYETAGQGPALLLLHGGLLDHRMWAQQVAALANDYQVITCDQRGHGWTVDGDSSYFMHEAVRMLLDSLHLRRAVIAGLSMGSTVATDFAIEYPQYTEKLILLVPGLNGGWKTTPEDSMMVRSSDRMQRSLEQRDTLAAAEAFIHNWFDGPQRQPEQTDTLQRRLAVQMAYRTLRVHKNLYWVRSAEPKSITRLDKITCPTLIIVSEKDNPIIGRCADQLQRAIPDTKRVTIAGVAHLPNMERPKEVNRAIVDFMKR